MAPGVAACNLPPEVRERPAHLVMAGLPLLFEQPCQFFFCPKSCSAVPAIRCRSVGNCSPFHEQDMARKDKLPSHGADKYPRALSQFAVVKVDRNFAGILLEGKMISEFHVKLFSGDSLCEPPSKLLDISTRSDIGKEILTDGLGFVDSSQTRLVIVILQNRALVVQLNRPKWERIELSRIQRVNRDAI
jgi:hypothetical protein